MQRALALLLAMAALLAHALAIHVDAAGNLGLPRDGAYVAFRVARNWVQFGDLAWNLGGAVGLEAYPSPLLILTAALVERLHLTWLSVTIAIQVLGVVCALSTLAVTARFSIDRIAGIVPPLLLVSSGTLAEAALSGTEWAPFTLALAITWVATERGRPFVVAVGGAALVALRPEGALLLLALGVLAVVQRVRRGAGGPGAAPAWSFVPGVVVAAVLVALERADGTSLYGTWWASLVAFDPVRAAEGLLATRDAFAAWVVPILLPFPLAAALFGKLSGVGLRALLLAGLWLTLVTVNGGSNPAMHIELAPALPLLCVALQQGILTALDTESRTLESLAWVALLTVAGAGAAASRFPRDLGPLPIGDPMVRWLTARGPTPIGAARAELRVGEETQLVPQQGRVAVQDEIDHTIRMHALGLFLRDRGPKGTTLGTIWPGAVAYLTSLDPSSTFAEAPGETRTPVEGLRVLDLSGRVPAEGQSPAPLHGAREELALDAALAAPPDLLLPGPIRPDSTEAPHPVLERVWPLWYRDRELADRDSDEHRSWRAAVEALSPVERSWFELLSLYEWIAVPVSNGTAALRPLYLLRRARAAEGARDLLARPAVEVRIEGREVTVDTAGPSADGLPQLLNFRIDLQHRLDGSRATVDPFGRVDERPTLAGVGTLVAMREGQRERLAQFTLPAWFDADAGDRVVVRLMNSGVPRQRAASTVGVSIHP